MDLLNRLAAIGAPIDVAKADGEIEKTVTVENVDQLRTLLDHGFDSQRRADHFEALFDGIDVSGGDAGEDSQLVHRVTGYVIGDRDLATEDREAIAPAFPLEVNVLTSLEPITISERKDISTDDGRLRIADYSDVTMTQGGFITCCATPLQFTCQTLTRTGDTGGREGDFNLVGKVGVTPPKPATPSTPTQATKGKNGECTSSGIAGPGGEIGPPAAEGTTGTRGTPGNPGGPSQHATIIIKSKLTCERLTISTVSGPGGRGGDGGDGGQGQKGGDGGDGVTCGCTGNGGGPGRDGGKGGPGGPAGDGGPGVDAVGDIVVKVPTQDDIKKVIPIQHVADAGEAGTPGTGGPGGGGGAGGAAGKYNNPGGDGGNPGKGRDGDPGDRGTVTGKPATFDIRRL